VLGQQGISQQFQHPFSAPPSSSVICQLFCKWLDDLEHFGHFAFVMGEHDALCQDVRNDKKPLGRHVPQLNRSSRLNLILGLTGERNNRGFILKALELPTDPGRQLSQEAAFVLR